MGEKRIDRFVYQLKDKIGEGSFGQVLLIDSNFVQVFKGIDEKSKQVVAIKMVPKSLINKDEYLMQGLMSEIRIMQKLKSHNIVMLLDVLETGNNYYIIQEFCDGGDFAHYLKKKKILSEKEALKLMRDMLRGFLELVRSGVIHRDLKPANILINQGDYKLADFGFAKCVDNFKKDMLESSVGTPLYMSPQILSSDKYTSKSDVWSMGFIFYEALYGQTPWTGRSIPELLRNINTQKLAFLDSKNKVSEQTKDLLTGFLQLEEQNRLSWDDIFTHPLFCDNFSDYIDQHQKLEDKAKYLVNDLRQKIVWDKVDLEQLFKELDISNDQALNMKELSDLLKRIDKKLTREEIEYIFNKIDEDGNNSIEFDEFKNWLQTNDIRLTTKTPNTLVKQKTIEESRKTSILNEEQQQQQQSYQKSQSFSTPKVQWGVQNNQGQTYPQNTTEMLKIQPVQQNLGAQQIAQQPSINQQQMNQWGQQSGQNVNTQQIPSWGNQPNYGQTNQWQNNLSGWQQPMALTQNAQWAQQNQGGWGQGQQYGMQQAYQLPNQNQIQPNMDKPKQIIYKLNLAIQKYNINLQELFKKYDKSFDSNLDVKEFGILIRKIDPSLSEQDVQQAFGVFDKDGSGGISFQEFKDVLQQQKGNPTSFSQGHTNPIPVVTGNQQQNQNYWNQNQPNYYQNQGQQWQQGK